MSAAVWSEPPERPERPSRNLRTGNRLYRIGSRPPVRVSNAVADVVIPLNPCNFGPCSCGNPVCPEVKKNKNKST